MFRSLSIKTPKAQQHTPSTRTGTYFDLKLLRTIKDIDNILGKDWDPSVTDDGLLTYANGENQLFYDTLEITKHVNKKLSRNSDTKEYEAIDSFTWLPTGRSYIAYKEDKIFCIFFDVKIKVVNNELEVKVKPYEPFKLNIQLNSYELSITKVFTGPNPDNIVICCSSELEENIFLLWDCYENREIQNYSNKGKYVYLTGRGSDSGYILNEDKYVDMNEILDNYFFQVDFLNFYDPEQLLNGYKVSEKQEIMLWNGNILLKVWYIDFQTLKGFVENKESLTEDNITIEKIKFQIEGSTILHLFALNFEKLSLILNFLKEKDKRYLTMILIK